MLLISAVIMSETDCSMPSSPFPSVTLAAANTHHHNTHHLMPVSSLHVQVSSSVCSTASATQKTTSKKS